MRELHKLMGASPTTSLLSSQDYVTVAEFAARVFGDQVRGWGRAAGKWQGVVFRSRVCLRVADAVSPTPLLQWLTWCVPLVLLQARASQTFILMLLRNAAWYSVSWTEVTSGGKPKVALLTACLYTLHNIYR